MHHAAPRCPVHLFLGGQRRPRGEPKARHRSLCSGYSAGTLRTCLYLRPLRRSSGFTLLRSTSACTRTSGHLLASWPIWLPMMLSYKIYSPLVSYSDARIVLCNMGSRACEDAGPAGSLPACVIDQAVATCGASPSGAPRRCGTSDKVPQLRASARRGFRLAWAGCALDVAGLRPANPAFGWPRLARDQPAGCAAGCGWFRVQSQPDQPRWLAVAGDLLGAWFSADRVVLIFCVAFAPNRPR